MRWRQLKQIVEKNRGRFNNFNFSRQKFIMDFIIRVSATARQSLKKSSSEASGNAYIDVMHALMLDSCTSPPPPQPDPAPLSHHPSYTHHG